MSDAWRLLRHAAREWQRKKAPLYAAAIAFYAMVSIAPLLLLAVVGVGVFLDTANAEQQTIDSVRSLLSDDGVRAVRLLLADIRNPENGLLATVVGSFVVLFGASRIFVQLRSAFDEIFGTEPARRGWRRALQDRGIAFLVVVAVGAVLVASLAVSTILSALSARVPSGLSGTDWLWRLLDLSGSLAFTTLAFGLIYRWLSAIELRWRSVLVGAFAGATFFAVGKIPIAVYLARVSAVSVYGAAGSLIVVMLWAYYSAQILFLGALIAKTWEEERRRGSFWEP